MPNYSNADKAVRSLIDTLIEANHEDLKKYGVKIGLLFATSDSEDDAPVKLHGWPCHAVVSKTSTKHRALGLHDAIIIIDGNEKNGWPDWKAKRRSAIMDHELEHLRLQTDKHGEIKYDCNNRPMIEIKQHDYEFGGFDIIAERHGNHSIEVVSIAHLAARTNQLLFPWMNLENAEAATKIVKLAADKSEGKAA